MVSDPYQRELHMHSVHTKNPLFGPVPWGTETTLHCLSSRSPWQKNKHIYYTFDLEGIRKIARRLWWKYVWLKKEGKSHSHACAKCYLVRACSAPASGRTGLLLTWVFLSSFPLPHFHYNSELQDSKTCCLLMFSRFEWKNMCCKIGLWMSTMWVSTSWQVAESPEAQLSLYTVLSLYCYWYFCYLLVGKNRGILHFLLCGGTWKLRC